jgi:hypothetical protein
MAAEQPAHPSTTFSTWRLDNWWAQPLSLVVALTAFVVYSMFRVFEMRENPVVALEGFYHYQSPFVAMDFTWLIPASVATAAPYLAYPGVILLPFPAGFRFTCYYFRRAYYRSFVARPAACSTEANRNPDYKGETKIMIFQNLHRYFFYATFILLVLHIVAWVMDVFHGGGVYVGVGTLLLLIDIVLLAGYVLGCHAFRHLIGGRVDCFSCSSVNEGAHTMWGGVSKLNQKHAFYALASMISIVVADFYLRWIGIHQVTTVLWGIPA